MATASIIIIHHDRPRVYPAIICQYLKIPFAIFKGEIDRHDEGGILWETNGH